MRSGATRVNRNELIVIADKPLAIDLYCGLGGWTDGLLVEGYRVIGFDNERHQYGDERYPGQLVIQDVRTIHGRQLKDAALIVGSSPCQEFSYRAMPWKRAKALPPPYLGIELFEAQFRIQREACEAAGHFIPLVVENVRGAQKYVGRSKYHFGSFHLWGDVPALNPDGRPNNARDRIVEEIKGAGGGWFNDNKRAGKGPTGYLSRSGSKSSARKRASAMIAKIPLVLSRHIAASWYPISDGAPPYEGSACCSPSSVPQSDGHAREAL